MHNENLERDKTRGETGGDVGEGERGRGRDIRADAGACFGPTPPRPVCPLHPARPDTVTVNYRTECGAENRESS